MYKMNSTVVSGSYPVNATSSFPHFFRRCVLHGVNLEPGTVTKALSDWGTRAPPSTFHCSCDNRARDEVTTGHVDCLEGFPWNQFEAIPFVFTRFIISTNTRANQSTGGWSRATIRSIQYLQFNLQSCKGHHSDQQQCYHHWSILRREVSDKWICGTFKQRSIFDMTSKIDIFISLVPLQISQLLQFEISLLTSFKLTHLDIMDLKFNERILIEFERSKFEAIHL